MCPPFIGFSFSVIGHPTTGVIKKQLGEVDAQRQGSGVVLCAEAKRARGLLIIEFSRIEAGGVKHERVIKYLTRWYVNGLMKSSPEDIWIRLIDRPPPR